MPGIDGGEQAPQALYNLIRTCHIIPRWYRIPPGLPPALHPMQQPPTGMFMPCKHLSKHARLKVLYLQMDHALGLRLLYCVSIQKPRYVPYAGQDRCILHSCKVDWHGIIQQGGRHCRRSGQAGLEVL